MIFTAKHAGVQRYRQSVVTFCDLEPFFSYISFWHWYKHFWRRRNSCTFT